jgi:hypothetical protein
MHQPKARLGFIGNPAILQYGAKDNTGNIIHGYAARSIFENIQKITSSAEPGNIADVRAKCTHIGFVAATMLHVNRVPKYIQGHVGAANFVEKAGLPVCTFGFGCQAPLGQSVKDAEVDPRSVRLLQVIAAHARSIAVRGAFTADLCAKYGVKNVEVIGCQSAYVAGVANWAAKTEVRAPVQHAVAYLSLGPDERELLRLVLSSHSDIIGQGDPTEEGIRRGEISKAEFLSPNSKHWEPPYLVKLFEEGIVSREAYFDFVSDHFFKFYDVPNWIEHIRSRYDFCYGTRFHGNMAAFQAGVPALWLTHDMRTQELCEHLNLPFVEHSSLVEFKTLPALAAQCSYERFWSQFPARLRQFRQYLDGNGMTELLKPAFRQASDQILATVKA